MKVFLDTNVLVSGFATRGLSADVIRHVMAKHELITAEVVLDELPGLVRFLLAEVLGFVARKKVSKK